MPKFSVTVTAKIPKYMEAEVEVEAATQKEAKEKIRAMYEKDEIEFDDGELDYDEAEIDSISFKK